MGLDRTAMQGVAIERKRHVQRRELHFRTSTYIFCSFLTSDSHKHTNPN